MGHKRMVVVDGETSGSLSRMSEMSGMSVEELLAVAVRDLEQDKKILRKDKHEKLVAKVCEVLGDDADKYDTDAMARVIAHARYDEYAMRGDIHMYTTQYGEQKLVVSNHGITLSDYMV